MTTDDIKARCEQVLSKLQYYDAERPKLEITIAAEYLKIKEHEEADCRELESLYREAMAKGLEMAAEHIEKFADAKTLPARTTLFESFCLQEGQVLRTRALKLKETL